MLFHNKILCFLRFCCVFIWNNASLIVVRQRHNFGSFRSPLRTFRPVRGTLAAQIVPETGPVFPIFLCIFVAYGKEGVHTGAGGAG